MVKLIAASDVISTAFVDQNINSAKIKDSYIEVAQENYIMPVLGVDFYEEVLANKTAAHYSDLVTQLKPALCYYVKYLALPEIMVSITDKGALLSFSQTNTTLDAKGRGDVRSVALMMAEKYMDIAVRWLEHEDNIDYFPNYYESKNIKKRITRKGGLIL